MAFVRSNYGKRGKRLQVTTVEDNTSLLQEPGPWVFNFSANALDSFMTPVKAAGLLWKITRTLSSLVPLY